MPAPLTADRIARAVIAAARIYRMDPLAVGAPYGGRHRRPLTAVAIALMDSAELSAHRVRRLMGLSQVGLKTAIERSKGPGVHARAVSAAREALKAGRSA